MRKITENWWRILLKDATSMLYARVDIVHKTDDSLEIAVNIQELGAKIVITFEDGKVKIIMQRFTGSDVKTIAEETMELDGKFTWKEDSSSDPG